MAGRKQRNERGDTLIEVVMALAILSMTLLSSSSIALKSFQIAQTARERSTVAFSAQAQLEDVRAFRDNHAWAEFLGGSASPHYQGVLSAAASGCHKLATCFHMANVGGVMAPVAGSITDSGVPGSYIEIMPVPGAGSPPGTVKLEVAWGFESIGGMYENADNLRTELTDIRVEPTGVAVAAVPPTPVFPPLATPIPTPCVIGAKDIVLALDASHSMSNAYGVGTRASELRSIVNSFISSANVSPPSNHIGLMKFGSSATVLSGFSSDPASLHAAVSGYDAENVYSTYFTPALVAAHGLFAVSRPGAEKVFILVTDGDLTPTDTPAAAMAASGTLKAAGVHVYTIGIANPPAAGVSLLSSIATSPSDYGNAAVASDLDQIIDAILGTVTC